MACYGSAFYQVRKIVPSSNLITSHGSLRLRNSQSAYAKVGVMQTAFTYPSFALQPTGEYETRVIAGLTVRVNYMLGSWINPHHKRVQ